MNVPTPRVKTLGGMRFMAKTKGSFDIRFADPCDIPVLWEVGEFGIMIAANGKNGNRAALAPAFDCPLDGGGHRFWAVHQIAQHQNAAGTRFFRHGRQCFQIMVENRTWDRDSMLLKHFRLPPVSIGENQCFFLVPVDRFPPVEGELLSPYFC